MIKCRKRIDTISPINGKNYKVQTVEDETKIIEKNKLIKPINKRN